METLSEREQEILKFIASFRRDNFMQSPTQQEIFDYLNKLLPKRKGGKPALISVVQITRAVETLRKGCWLIQRPTRVWPGSTATSSPLQKGRRWQRKLPGPEQGRLWPPLFCAG
jgi:hypothetical protein